MKTRRFRGNNLREALDKVRTALGEDAIIVSTRKSGDGAASFGGGGDAYVEVEASTPELEAGDKNGGQHAAPKVTHASLDDIQEPGEITKLFGEIEPAAGLALEADDSEFSDLFYELCESGISDETAREILARAVEEAGNAGSAESPEARRVRVKRLLSLLFEVKAPITRSGSGGPAITTFIGPTGTGKTTTIAKLAAQCTKRRLKVGLITLDTQRVGGAEQMKMLGKLLSLPVIAASSRGQLEQAVAKFRRADVILVDSPGRSISDEAGMSELEEIFGRDKIGENYLVLAANTHSEDLKRMAESFSRMPLDGLVFTKLDEASRFGVIFELHMDLGVPVAYLTSGQKIPGGLAEASQKTLAQLILPPARELVSAQGAVA